MVIRLRRLEDVRRPCLGCGQPGASYSAIQGANISGAIVAPRGRGRAGGADAAGEAWGACATAGGGTEGAGHHVAPVAR